MTTLVEPRPHCALVYGDQQVNYPEFLRQVRARASHMPQQAGERVVVYGENCPDWAYCAYAAWVAHAVLVPVDHLSTATELAFVIDDCQPALIICSGHTRDTVDRALSIAQRQPRVLTFDALESAGAVPGDASASPPITVDEAVLAAIVYTSGTTGAPKGVMLSFGNLLANVRPVVHEGYFTPKARVLLLLPLHHVLPLVGSLVAPLYGGSTIVFATSMAGQELLALLSRHRITAIVGVPRFYDLLHRALRERIESSLAARQLFAVARRIRSRGFSRLVFGSVHRKFGGALEHLICGGAALNPATAETFDVLGFLMCEGFGMTECAPMITFPRPEAVRLGSCGQVLDGCEVRVDDSGEILARGPNVMMGYYGHPEDTSAILRDGWLHTGDLGKLDEQGYLYVTGRLKEILVLLSGKKVDPGSVEAALQASPALREAGVFLDGDTLHAVAVPNWETLPISDLDAAEATLRRDVIEPYNATVSPYRRIAGLTLVNTELPRTRLGKLRRHLLPGIAAQAARATSSQDQLQAPADGAAARLIGYLARLSGKPVQTSSRLDADLGLDSLARVELSVFVERAFGIVIPEAKLAEVETVGALARFVARCEKEGREAPTEAVSWAELLRSQTAPLLPHSSVSHRAIVYLSRIFVRALFRIRARGSERVPHGPFILVPNHQSYLDGLFVAAYLRPRAVLETMLYAKEQHVGKGWLKSLAQRCNTIVMDPKAGFLGSLRQLAAGLKRGNNLMIFPEGTRSSDGRLGPFKDSYAILARELGIPVVPVVIDGAYGVLPRGKHFPKLFCPIRITYLDALRAFDAESPAAFNARVRGLIERELGSEA